MNIGYARISTSGQNLDRQIAALRDEGCEAIFRETASGKSMTGRPQLDRAIDQLGSIRALQQHHTAVERWLETEVAATYDKLIPDSTHSSEDVFEALRAHHAKSLKGEA